MGSRCELTLVATTTPDFTFLCNELDRLESKYSRFIETSYLNAINSAAKHGESIALDDETSGLIALADHAYNLTGGLFDITSCKLSKIWDFKKAIVPSENVIQKALSQTGWAKCHWASPILTFTTPNIQIDLGGLVKEYAADRCRQLAIEQGFEAGLFDLGGDISVFGSPPHQNEWRIGIKNPMKPKEPIATITLTQQGLSSSGNYERFFKHSGQHFGHIIHPTTGQPVMYAQAVSVVHPQTVIAGILSTSAMLMPESEAITWLNELGVKYILINRSGDIYQG